jgi:hypothetical protein
MNQTKNRTAPFSLPNAEQSYSVLKKWNGAAPFFFALEPNGPLMRLSLIMPGPPFSDWTALSHDRMRDWLCRPPHRLGLVSDSFSDLDTAHTLSPLAPPVPPSDLLLRLEMTASTPFVDNPLSLTRHHHHCVTPSTPLSPLGRPTIEAGRASAQESHPARLIVFSSECC